MASNTGIKYPLCVEWTTDLPFVGVPRESINISLWDSVWFFVLKCVEPDGNFSLCLLNINSEKRCLDNPQYVTTSALDVDQTFLKDLTEQVRFHKTDAPLWVKTRKQLVDTIPSIFLKGKMKIMCIFQETETGVDKIHVSKHTTWKNASYNLKILSRDFSTLLKDRNFSDVKLQCADRSFSAHRSILAARSEVFAAMFRIKMAKEGSGVVHIKDMDPEVLELLLEFMYSAKKPKLCEETVHRVSEAAGKYAVHGLKRACFDWLIENQTTDNCLDLLVLADKHSDENFKESVACFVAEHLADLNAQSWSTFSDKYPLLVLSVLKKRCEDCMPGAAKRAKY